MTVKAIPDGYHTVTPYLLSSDAARVLEFVKQAFGASETERMDGEGGAVRHASVRIGDSMVMIGQAGNEYEPLRSMLYLYVPDVDAVYAKAIDSGGKSLREPTNEFYGDRSAGVEDPTGNQWWIATHVEDVSPEEMQRRASATPSA